MALQILKNPSRLPNMDNAYYHHASVEIRRNTGLRRLLNPEGGTVAVSPSCDPSCPVIQVVPPVWKHGEKNEWNLLRQCYEQVLRLALKHRCDAIVLSLLTAGDPKFPTCIDYKIAVDTIRTFLECCSMDVFLVVSQPSALQMPELRADVEKFLSRNFFEVIPQWGYARFTDNDARFTTIVPAPDCCGETLPCAPDCYGGTLPYASHSYGEALPDAPAPMQSCRFDTGTLPSRSELEAKLCATDAGFSETLLKLIDRTGKKDSEIYNKANVSRQHFSKIRNNPDYKPTKSTAIAFAIALELNMDETRDLIGRAGYTLTNSSKFDVIIMYFIQKRNYNMFDINETLFEFDQNLLGA